MSERKLPTTCSFVSLISGFAKNDSDVIHVKTSNPRSLAYFQCANFWGMQLVDLNCEYTKIDIRNLLCLKEGL